MVVIAVVALVVAGALVWFWQAEDSYVAPPPEPTATGSDSAAASQTLRRLEAALAGGDSAAAGDLGAGDDGRTLLGAAADNVSEIGLDDIGLRYLGETDAPMTADGWSAEVEVTWRVEGGDRTAVARADVEFDFADGGDRISGIGGELTPLWLQGPVTARRGGGAVVVTADPSDRLDRYHSQARAAVAEVRQRLGQPMTLVVEVPRTPAALNRTVGAEEGTYDAVAAVTTGADGSVVPGTPFHVFLNPRVYGGLDGRAAQVVMTHEAVHVATEAPLARRVPLWLLEGFADFIALQDVDLPLEKSAGQILDRVRSGNLPDSLPDAADFNTDNGHLGATYEAAWQVCEVLAARRGDAEVVAFYEAVIAGSDVGAELEERFDWTEAELTGAWQERLRDLATNGG